MQRMRTETSGSGREMRKHSMKKSKRGYTRSLGLEQNGKSPKFYLGDDKHLAKIKREKIEAIWKSIENEFEKKPPIGQAKPYWTEEKLKAARELARGSDIALKKHEGENAIAYYKRLRNTEFETLIAVKPHADDHDVYNVGKLIIGMEYRNLGKYLTDSSESEKLTGTNVEDAIERYISMIKANPDYQSASGYCSVTGAKKISQIKTISSYIENVDLGFLNQDKVEETFNIFRGRPISKRYNQPMTRKSCSNYIKELDFFLKWLHRTQLFNWRLPADYHLIKKKVKKFEGDTQGSLYPVKTFSIDELKIINYYARPIERILFLLGINCAYGADQSGRLQVDECIKNDEGTITHTQRIRFKKETVSAHKIWKQTAQGLKWAIDRAKSITVNPTTILITKNKTMMYHQTKAGNRAQAITNIWNALKKRIRKDHPDFPNLPFNSLRDTSTNLVRELAGEEIARLQCAHAHQSSDPNLKFYSNPLFHKLFETLDKLEEIMGPVFEAAGPAPWTEQKKSILSKQTIVEVKNKLATGESNTRISKDLGVSLSTIHNYKKESN